MMRSTPDFRLHGELRRWLAEQPQEVAVVIAARAALRVLPLTTPALTEARSSLWMESRLLSCWGHILGCRRSPHIDPALRAAARAAADVASHAAVEVATRAIFTAAARAADAAAASGAPPAPSPSPLRVPPLTPPPPPPPPSTWPLTPLPATGRCRRRGRCRWSSDRRGTAIVRACRPGASLWRMNGRPKPIEEAWTRLKTVLLAASDGWDVWIEWYEDRLAARPADLDLEGALSGYLICYGSKARRQSTPESCG